MEKPLLSICIPTFNRAEFLRECLESITKQFSNQEVKNKVNVFILDNQSVDNTYEVSKAFADLYSNVEYIRDSEPRKIVPGIVEAASYADGKYVWVFSDDDLQSNNTLKFVLKSIETDQSDLIICNLNSFFGKLEKISLNLLKIKQDYLFKNRKDFFKYLNKRVFDNIDFYTTFCSNFILRKEILDDYHYILNKFNGSLDVFPFHSVIYYSDADITVKIISTPILFIRGDNESWGSRNKIKHYLYRRKLWKYHYKNIIKLNRKNFSFLFPLKIKVKNELEVKNLINYLVIVLLKKIYLYKAVKLIYYKLKSFKK